GLGGGTGGGTYPALRPRRGNPGRLSPRPRGGVGKNIYPRHGGDFHGHEADRRQGGGHPRGPGGGLSGQEPPAAPHNGRRGRGPAGGPRERRGRSGPDRLRTGRTPRDPDRRPPLFGTPSPAAFSGRKDAIVSGKNPGPLGKSRETNALEPASNRRRSRASGQ